MKRYRVVAYSIVLAALTAATVAASERKAPRAVIELFTSQGCSSCPAADRLLGELARDPALVAMSLPIDYWDYLGWKDTLANPRHSARQRAYAKARGDREVYTPQIVVNGLRHALGSDKGAIDRAIEQTLPNAKTLSVPVTLTKSGNRFLINMTAAGNGVTSAEVWLCALAKSIPVTIARGENRGRTITYHNVVRRWYKVGDWNGDAHSWSVPTSDFATDNSDSVAVLVQTTSEQGPGKMLGAALAPLQ
jgi:hypothetical protein